MITSVNNVSFQGRLAQTKKGNTYEKTNTGKNIGTGVGLVGGIALATTPFAQLLSLSAAGKVAKSLGAMTGITYGILAAVVTAATLIGRGIGAIPDAIVNNTRKNKVDKAAETKINTEA